MNRLTVKKCLTQDWEILLAIVSETFADSFQHLNTPENYALYASEYLIEKKIRQELSHPGSTFYFYYLNNELAGYTKINELSAQTEKGGAAALEIERIYLYKKFQGKRLGQEMMDHLIKLAREQNKSKIWLGVWEKNTGAIRFYERMGFKKFDSHVFHLGQDPQTDWLMEMHLE